MSRTPSDVFSDALATYMSLHAGDPIEGQITISNGEVTIKADRYRIVSIGKVEGPREPGEVVRPGDLRRRVFFVVEPMAGLDGIIYRMKKGAVSEINVAHLAQELVDALDLLGAAEGEPCDVTCPWSPEQIGYEEKARLVWVCETHGTERPRDRRTEW